MAQTELPQAGSIADIAARLALWGRRAPKGLARAEFVSDFSRQEAVSQLHTALPQDKPLHEIELPYQQPAVEVVQYLRERLRGLPPGVVSVTGFATAFTDDCSLADSLRVLNFHREVLADFPLCQIWWMTHPFAETFLRSIPDLDSWFILRLDLSETIVQEVAHEQPSRILSDTDLDEARKQSQQYVERFETAHANSSPISALVFLAIAATATLHNAGLQTEEKQIATALLNDMEALLSECGLSKINFDSNTLILPQDLRRLAQLYEQAGKTDKAETLYLLSLKTSDNSLWSGFNGVDQSSELLIGFYIRQHRYSDAELLCKHWITRAEELFADTSQNISFHIIISLDKLLQIYLLQKKDTEAEQVFYRMLSMARGDRLHDIGLESSLLNNIAWFYKRLGRYAEAQAALERQAMLQNKA